LFKNVANNLPAQFKKAQFQPFKIDDGRIKMPLNIDGQEQFLMFDTGSSLFALITSEENANKVSKKSINRLTQNIKLGRLLVYGKKTDKIIKFGNKILQQSLVFFDKQHKSDGFYKDEKIWGITGYSSPHFLDNH
jgi:hypothetical protein